MIRSPGKIVMAFVAAMLRSSVSPVDGRIRPIELRSAFPLVTTILMLVGLLAASACQQTPALEHSDPDARIARIEQGIIPIDESGADSGSPQFLSERMAALDVPALSIAVFDEGRILWARAYGLRDRSSGAAVDTATLFQAASISKPVTSTALFQLVEEGVLALDEDVNKRLKSWKVPENGFTQDEKVTPRRIVSHMAGLTVHGFAGYSPHESLPTVQQILDGVPPANSSPVRVDATPGVRESYSGGGFTVLQLLMEEVSGRPFAALVRDLVLQPAGMSHSTFAQPLPLDLTDQAATGYDRDGEAVEGRYHVYPELAAAGLWTTPSDLARFMLAVGRSYRGEPNGLVEQSSARTMLSKVPGGSGQGFGLSGEGEAFRYRHNGGNAGFTCYAVAFTGTGRGAILMTNSDGGSQLMHEVARAISREYGWPPLWVRD
jgi:CubicO group peptidase (beta-lactamase class C family)